MKKFLMPLAASAVLASSLFAVDSKVIENYFDFLPAGMSVKVGETSKIEGTNFEMVELEFSQNGMTQNDFIFVQDGVMAPDIINLATKQSYKEEIKQKDAAIKLGGAYKSEDQNKIIKIGSDPTKETIVIFTDPECPYCRAELDRIDDVLKNNNVEIILISVHGDTAFDKINQIYKEMPSAITDKEKIDILSKYYAKDAKAPKSSQADMKNARALSTKYFQAGIQGVPYKIEANKLK